MWGNLDDSEKVGLQAKAEKGMSAYRKKAETYRKTAGFKKYEQARKEFKKKNKAAKRIKALKKSLKNKPKRAPSAYFLFANEERARILKKNASLKSDVAKVAKLIGEAWGSVSDKDKVRFQSKAATLKVKADKKIATYRKSSEWKNYLEEKKCIVKEEKAARKAAEKAECGDAPPRHPRRKPPRRPRKPQSQRKQRRQRKPRRPKAKRKRRKPKRLNANPPRKLPRKSADAESRLKDLSSRELIVRGNVLLIY